MGIAKQQLLMILAGTACPICNQVKAAHVWTCPACYKPHAHSPEHLALSDQCDVHMDAARAFLEMVKARAQKPETD